MSLLIKISPKANQDLDDLFEYLAKENENTALRFFDSFRETIAKLSKMTNIGKSYQVANTKLKGLRQYRVKGFTNFLLFYLATDNLLIIVRIIYENCDIQSILKNE